ncbi:MAG: HD domain-containing protein [Bacteroidota bacterium]
MNEQQLQILREAKKLVKGIFQSKVTPLFTFHNLEHTAGVVAAAEEIEGYYQLNDEARFVLLVSAWFHDTGFSTGVAEWHERESIKLASDFLYQHHVPPDTILQVSACILATHMPQTPLTLTEKILRDADLFHLGENIFYKRNRYLKQELQAYFKKNIPEEEWRLLNIRFLQSHKYFTGYCQQKLDPVKQVWIKQLQNKQETMA